MNAADLLARLHAEGVSVGLDGGTIVLDAPRGALTSELVAELRIRKPEVITALTGRTPRPSPGWSDGAVRSLVEEVEERLVLLEAEHPPPGPDVRQVIAAARRDVTDALEARDIDRLRRALRRYERTARAALDPGHLVCGRCEAPGRPVGTLGSLCPDCHRDHVYPRRDEDGP